MSENEKSGPSNASVHPICYSSLSVVDLIDHFLTLIRDAPIYMTVRRRLIEIRDGIFIELPETRVKLLCRIGHVINECVPSGESHNRIEPFWYEIREIMEKRFDDELLRIIEPERKRKSNPLSKTTN